MSMFRWYRCFILYSLLQFITYLIIPIISCFWEIRNGWCDNHSYQAEAPRLKKWLSWFDTPDNSLMGDQGWRDAGHDGARWIDRCKWLYRNSLYGFKWTVIAAKITSGRIFEGNTRINYRGPVFGSLSVQMGEYWQKKSVIRLNNIYCLVLNFGWLLDDPTTDVALFMCSPRLKRIVYDNK